MSFDYHYAIRILKCFAEGKAVERLQNGQTWVSCPDGHVPDFQTFLYRQRPYKWGNVETIPEDAVFINPYTKLPRDARDVFSDPYGMAILGPAPKVEGKKCST